MAKVTVPVVFVIVNVVESTLPVKVTPAWLLVIVTAPAVADPTSPIVARPPASRIVKPPVKSTIEVNVIVAPAVDPESSVKANPPLVTAPTLRMPVPAFPVSNSTAAVRVTPAKVIARPVVVTFTPRLAALATVNALLNVEAAVVNATPSTAVSVVNPVIAPPPETLFTVIDAPAPAPVIESEPVAVMKSSSVSVMSMPPAPAVPTKMSLPELPVMVILLTASASVMMMSLAVTEMLPPLRSKVTSWKFTVPVAPDESAATVPCAMRTRSSAKAFAVTLTVSAPVLNTMSPTAVTVRVMFCVRVGVTQSLKVMVPDWPAVPCASDV